jgi:hypothetical protein
LIGGPGVADGNAMSRPRLHTFKSDTLYMIARGTVRQGGVCRIVSEASGKIGERISLGGALRHVVVVEPWERIYYRDRGALPAIVRRAIEFDDLDDNKFVWDDSIAMTQCVYCKYLVAGHGCAAFPGGIPDEIFANEYDHRRPWIDPDTGEPGDEGVPLAGSILFEPRPDVPAAALKTLYLHLDQLKVD